MLFALLLLSLPACRKNKINLTIDELEGQWVRQPDNKPQYTGLGLDISGTDGIISPGTGRLQFPDDTKKWRNITTLRDSVFFYEDLGSDGKYYEGQFSVSIQNGEWFIYAYVSGVSQAQGQAQTWRRQ